MKSRELRRMGRSELAERLREMANMVEHGTIRVGSATIEVPDDIEYELELEEERDASKLEIELEWETQAFM